MILTLGTQPYTQDSCGIQERLMTDRQTDSSLLPHPPSVNPLKSRPILHIVHINLARGLFLLSLCLDSAFADDDEED